MRDTLVKISGVSGVDVDFTRALATISLDTEKNTPEKVAEELSTRTRGRYSASVKKLER